MPINFDSRAAIHGPTISRQQETQALWVSAA